MPTYPSNVATVVVTGNWGADATGLVTFTPSAILADGTSTPPQFVMPNRVTEVLTNGGISVTLMATDDSHLSPSGWLWVVTEQIVGQPTRTYYLQLPESVPSIDLTAATKPTTPGALVAYVDAAAVGAVNGVVSAATLTTKGDLYVATAQGTVTREGVGTDGQVLTADSTSATGVSWKPTSGGVTSVNGHTGTVTLAATDVGAVATTAVGTANGVASLDGSGLVPAGQSRVQSVAGKTGAVVLAEGDITNLTADLANRTVYRGAWAAATVYAVNDLVTYADTLLLCKTAHTSGSSFAGLGNWTALGVPSHVFNVKLYGARGDTRTVTDAAMTAASATLTSATAGFTTADVGKTVEVKGAAAGGGNLVTTISAYVNATTVTLAASPSTTVSAATASYGTDDTAAINAAVTAAITWATSTTSTYYAEIYFPPAVYLVNGPLTQGGATKGNSLIPLPVIATTGQKLTLVLRGTRETTGLWHWQQTTSQRGGAVLKTTVVGTQDATYGEASVIGGPTPQQGYGRTNSLFSNLLTVIDGLEILVPNNPAICGVDLRGVGEANVVNAAVMADATPATVAAATTGWQWGLCMPQNNNNDNSTIGSYTAEGQNYGVIIDEHTVANSIRCLYCVAAVEVSSAGETGHGTLINYLSAEACQVGLGAIKGSFPCKVNIGLLDWEGGGPAQQFAVINDTSNNLLGTVHLAASMNHLSYGTTGFTVNGGVNLRIYEDTRHGGYPGATTVPASGTALMNPYFRDAMVVITGGTVSAIAVDGQSVGLTSGTVFVPTNRSITLTYTVAPSWTWILL